MVNVIRLKRRVTGSPGAPSSLKTAELAWNMADDIIYGGKGDDASGNATSIVPVGGHGAFVNLTDAQTVAGIKTFDDSPVIPTVSTGDNTTKAASTAFVKAQNYLTTNQSITISGDASGSGTTAITLTLATVATPGTHPKVTFNAKGLVTSGEALIEADIPTLTASKISNFDTQVRTSRLDQMAAPTGSLDLNSQKIVNLGTPTQATDAASKDYVDNLARGIDWKESVRVATTANITLSGAQTIDGVSVIAGDRVLVKNQSTGPDNGVYVAASGAWTRAIDFDDDAEVTAGAAMFVSEGTTNGNTTWALSTDDPITLDTTALVFALIGGGATGENNTGANVGTGTVGVFDGKSGVQLQFRTLNSLFSPLSLVLDSGNQKIDYDLALHASLENITNTLGIASTYVGQTSITTLGTIATGTWQGTIVGMAYGGTGVDLTALANDSLLKKTAGGVAAAVAGTDYLNTASTIDGGTF